MANLGSVDAIRLFPFQMGSAALTILAGLVLWAFQLGAQFHTHEQILLVGISLDHGIIGTTSLGNLEGRRSGRQRMVFQHVMLHGMRSVPLS